VNAPQAGHAQLLRLATLVELGDRARTLRGPELRYLIVNDTFAVAPYRKAALWLDGALAAVSGVAAPEKTSPYARWLVARLRAGSARAIHEPTVVTAAMLGGKPAEWDEWFAPEAVWVPIADPRGGHSGGLLLGRDEPWHPAELQLLASLSGVYGMAIAADELPRRRRRWRLGGHALRLAAVAAVVALAFVPVRSSVLAPAEIVARAPFSVRAPFEGVVESVRVRPNAPVKSGDLLVVLDTTERRARAEVSQKAIEIARAELGEATQLGLSDPRAKGRIAVLQGKLAQAELEAAYNRDMLARAEVRAPADGIAVFDDAEQWTGHPVVLGERIMVIGPPRSLDLDIAVPVAEILAVAEDAEMVFFPNTAPDSPERGHLTETGYAAQPTGDGLLAYHWRARLENAGGGLRLGLKGTAKVFGPTRPFVLWALRRPLAAVRAWLPF
jgi:hypothetical protein